MQTENDTSKPEDSPQQEAGEGCSGATCSAWAISSDSENYNHADFKSKEEAIAEGLIFYGGEPFYVGELEEPTPPEDLFDCGDWLEHVSCQEDYEGDHAEGWDSSTKEQREELNQEVRQVLSAWLDRHNLRPSFWNIPNGERIEPNVQVVAPPPQDSAST